MRTPRLWIALHLLAALLPTLGLVFHLPDHPLGGWIFPPAPPKVTSEDWRTEKSQEQIKVWFEHFLGFRGILARTDNSVFYAPLGETKPGASVKLGHRGTLFVDDDVWFSQKRPQDLPSVEHMRSTAKLVAEAQRRAAEKGKTLAVLLAPPKTAFYREDLPRDWQRREPPAVPADTVVYTLLRDALVDAGARFADGRAILGKEPNRELVYAPLGRHWTALGACIVARETTGGVIGPLPCRHRMIHPDEATNSDVDLFWLLNTWHPFGGPLPLVPEVVPESPPAERPRTLFIGSSFSWLIIDALRPFVREPHFFYYNSSVYDASTRLPPVLDKVDPNAPSWARYALEKDLYVLEIFEGYAHGNEAKDFLTALIARL